MMSTLERSAYRRGTHRVVAPEVTWARIRPELANYGITRVADVTGLDQLGVPVFQAVRPAARTLSVSQGKGVEPMAARVSAAMEAIELWHAEQIPVCGDLATPRECSLPYPFDRLDLASHTAAHADLPMRWLPATGLLSGARTAVPLELVRLDHTYAPVWVPPLFRATSNGLASGNTVAEATVHALAELCERDMLATLRLRDPRTWLRLNMNTVPDPDVAAIGECLGRDGSMVEVVVVHDIARASGPGCFEARIRSPLLPVTFTGSGCHLDPTVALLRALTEAAQSRLAAIAGARDDLPSLLYRSRPAAPLAPRAGTTAPLPWPDSAADRAASGNVYTDQGLLVDAVVERAGYEPARVTLHDEEVAVVKVVAPGLRFDDRVDISRPAAGDAR